MTAERFPEKNGGENRSIDRGVAASVFWRTRQNGLQCQLPPPISHIQREGGS